MIDVVLIGSSRPTIIRDGFKSFNTMVKSKQEFRWLYHEDVINREKSLDSIEWAFSKKRLCDIVINYPYVGQVASTEKMLHHIESKYFFYLEEDWEFLKEVDLDYYCGIMDTHWEINQIAFPKRKLIRGQVSKEAKARRINGTFFTPTRRWVSMPSIWRTSFIKDKWFKVLNVFINVGRTSNTWWICRCLNGGTLNRDPEWVIKYLGSYFVGNNKTDPWLKHIGEISTKKLRRI